VWASKQVVDIATGAMEGNLWGSAALVVALMIGQLFFSSLDTWLSACMPVDGTNRLRRRLFSHLLSSQWLSLQKYHSGDLINRVNRDVNDVIQLLTISIPALFVTLLQLIASFTYFCILDISLAASLLLIIPLFLLMSKVYMFRMRSYNQQIRKSDSAIQSVIQESVQQHIVIKTLETKRDRMDALDRLQDDLHQQVKSRTRLSLFSRVTLSMGFNSGYLFVFLWGVYRLNAGLISFGTMTAFLQLVGRVQRPAFDITSFVPVFIKTYTAAERLMDLENIALENDQIQNALESPVSLELQNLSFSYKEDSNLILKDFSFRFSPGSTTAILGETGAGKTTLIRLILGLISPTSGRIVLKSKNKQSLVSAATRSNFVYVPQGNSLFSGTIRDNLYLGNPEATEEELRAALETAVATFVFELPLGLDTVLAENGGGLSEGQAQRIAIARALLRKGSIFLFDEATSALDTDTESILLNRLQAQYKDKTMLFITHHAHLSTICDQTLRV